MDNRTYVNYEQTDGSVVTYIIIDKGNTEFISMTEAAYEAQQAAETLLSNSSIPQVTSPPPNSKK